MVALADADGDADGDAVDVAVADSLLVPDALGLGDSLALAVDVGVGDPDGEAVVEGDGEALLEEPPGPEVMSAAAVVAQAVAASTAAMVEQARRTRPLGEFMNALDQPSCHTRNGRQPFLTGSLPTGL